MKKRNIDYVGKEVPTETKTSDRDIDVEDLVNRQYESTKKDWKEKDNGTLEYQPNDFCYYSKLLQKPFNSLEELKKAEDEFKAKNALELKEKEERKLAAKEVEDAYRKLIEAKRKAADIINEAEKEYLEARNEFIHNYGSYHISYTNNNGKETVTFGDLVNKVFDRPKLPFFDDFFDIFR